MVFFPEDFPAYLTLVTSIHLQSLHLNKKRNMLEKLIDMKWIIVAKRCGGIKWYVECRYQLIYYPIYFRGF